VKPSFWSRGAVESAKTSEEKNARVVALSKINTTTTTTTDSLRATNFHDLFFTCQAYPAHRIISAGRTLLEYFPH
jgi:hypothetical protein